MALGWQSAGDAELFAKDDDLMMHVAGLQDARTSGSASIVPLPPAVCQDCGETNRSIRLASSAAVCGFPRVMSETV